MAYDATELEAALERPSITMHRPWWKRKLRAALNRLPGVDLDTGPVTYEGRILSHREWVPWQRKIQRYWNEIDQLDVDGEGADGGLPEELESKWQDFVRSYLLAIDLPPRAVVYVENMPYGPQVEAMKSFLACQRRAEQHGLEGLEETGSEDRPATSTPSGSRTKAPTAAT